MRIIVLFIFIINLYAQNLQIIKYVTNEKPKIAVEYINLPAQLKNILQKDTTIISHYQIDIKNQINNIKLSFNTNNYSGYNYLLRLNYQKNSLVALLYDLLQHKVVLYKRYKIPSFQVYPFMIHALSYDINNKLGFSNIPWIKRKIIYSIYMAPKEQSIFLADITLTYRKKIISGGLNIFPKWADKAQTSIYYTKLERQPVLYKYNIHTGAKERILTTPGMLIVSDVKKDKLLLTLAVHDQPDIYEYDIHSKALTRLTTFDGIDVNGQFYGDNKIVFISNRLGYPNVYQKDLDTNQVSKLIYYGKNHISVAVNKENVIVSTRETDNEFDNNTFNLLLIKKDSDVVKRLTFNGKNMLPRFSQDGNTVLFIKEYKFNSKLGIIRLNENKIFYFKINRKIQSFDF
jgi:TolB protein